MEIRSLAIWAYIAVLPLVSCSSEETKSKEESTEKKEEKKEEKGAEEKKESKPVKVRVTTVAQGSISSLIETTANVEAFSMIDVYPKLGGIVKTVLVEEGDRVEENQTLAKLEDDEYRLKEAQAEIAWREASQLEKTQELAKEDADQRKTQARRNADQAKRDHERSQNLDTASESGKTSLISRKDLEASNLSWDKAEGEYQTALFNSKKVAADFENAKIATQKAKIMWDLAKLQLVDTEIRARVAGVVNFRGIRLGETVTPATRSFTVVNLDHLQTNFYRPQKELRYLAAGIPIEASCEAFPESVFQGKVLRVNPVVDPTSGTFKVTAQIENPNGLLRPGMLIRTKITTAQHNDTHLIPKKAIFYEGEKPVIFAVREGTAVRIVLEAGFSDPERIEVLNIKEEGLRPDDRVIVIGNAELRDGTKVEIVEG